MGIFAVGDVGYRSVKRVGAAIGEGATVVQQIQAFLEIARASGQPVQAAAARVSGPLVSWQGLQSSLSPTSETTRIGLPPLDTFPTCDFRAPQGIELQTFPVSTTIRKPQLTKFRHSKIAKSLLRRDLLP